MRRKNLFGNTNTCDSLLYTSVFTAILSIIFAVIKANKNNFGSSNSILPSGTITNFVWYSQPLTGTQPTTPYDTKNYVITSVPIKINTVYQLQFTASTNTPSSLVTLNIMPSIFLQTYNSIAGTYTECMLFSNPAANDRTDRLYSDVSGLPARYPINYLTTPGNNIYFKSGTTNSADVLVFGFDINNGVLYVPGSPRSVISSYQTVNALPFADIVNTQNGKISVTMWGISIREATNTSVSNYLTNTDYTFGGSLNTGYVFPTTVASILSGAVEAPAGSTTTQVANFNLPANTITNATIMSKYADVARNIQFYIPQSVKRSDAYNIISIGSNNSVQLWNAPAGATYNISSSAVTSGGTTYQTFAVSKQNV